MRFLLRIGASVIGSIAAIVAAGAVALHYWPGTHKLTVAAAAVSPVLFVATAALALVCLLAIRAWLRIVVVVVVIAAGVWTQAPLFRSSGPPVSNAMTVLNSNIQVGQGSADELAALVREKHVDVLAVEELTEDAAARIAASSIAADLPHSFVRTARGANGTGLYSRYPLRDPVALPGFVLAGISATASVPGRGDVQVLALHPVPPLQTEVWDEELGRIHDVLQAVPAGRPVIALGDYNATYDHARFRSLLTGGYDDATRLAGAGWLPTYPTDKSYPAVVGIDHVLLRGLGASVVSPHEISGADHRAVLAKVG